MSNFTNLLDTMGELTEGLAEPRATRSPMQVAALAEVIPKVPDLLRAHGHGMTLLTRSEPNSPRSAKTPTTGPGSSPQAASARSSQNT
jgi:hypothetical protein